LAGLPGKIPDQKFVSTLFQDENFYTFFIKKYTFFYDVLNQVTPGQCTISCLQVQLLGIFIMM